jgi:hypothetical protein
VQRFSKISTAVVPPNSYWLFAAFANSQARYGKTGAIAASISVTAWREMIECQEKFVSIRNTCRNDIHANPGDGMLRAQFSHARVRPRSVLRNRDKPH